MLTFLLLDVAADVLPTIPKPWWIDFVGDSVVGVALLIAMMIYDKRLTAMREASEKVLLATQAAGSAALQAEREACAMERREAREESRTMVLSISTSHTAVMRDLTMEVRHLADRLGAVERERERRNAPGEGRFPPSSG